MIWFGLVWFYGISTIVGHLMPNLLYTHRSNIYDLFTSKSSLVFTLLNGFKYSKGLNISIWYVDRTLAGTTILGERESRNSGNEVLYIPQSYKITGASPSDCLVSYPGHSGESYPFVEMQSMYSAAPADWASSCKKFTEICMYIWATWVLCRKKKILLLNIQKNNLNLCIILLVKTGCRITQQNLCRYDTKLSDCKDPVFGECGVLLQWHYS